jgi:hypothetical protein
MHGAAIKKNKKRSDEYLTCKQIAFKVFFFSSE